MNLTHAKAMQDVIILYIVIKLNVKNSVNFSRCDFPEIFEASIKHWSL